MWYRGNLSRSSRVTLTPDRASRAAVVEPAGPPPITRTCGLSFMTKLPKRSKLQGNQAGWRFTRAWRHTVVQSIGLTSRMNGQRLHVTDLSKQPAASNQHHTASIDQSVQILLYCQLHMIRITSMHCGYRRPPADAVFRNDRRVVAAKHPGRPRLPSLSADRRNVGDTARLTAIAEAQHYPPDDHTRHLLLKSQHDVELAREASLWVMHHLQVENLWLTGDPKVAISQRRMAHRDLVAPSRCLRCLQRRPSDPDLFHGSGIRPLPRPSQCRLPRFIDTDMVRKPA